MGTFSIAMATVQGKIIRRKIVGAYLSSAVSISLVLLLVGVASVLLVNSRSVSDYFKENMKLSVLFTSDTEEKDALAYEKQISGRRYIKELDFVSREMGQKEMEELLGSDFLSVFESSPIPMSLDITLKAAYVSQDSLAMVSRELALSPLVDEIVYPQSLVEKLNANLRKLSLVLSVVIALLLFISFVLINNVVRLSIYDRRFIIHTMKLVGATRGFIRRPFVLRSVLLGLVSSLFSLALLAGVLYFVHSEFAMIFEVFTPKLLALSAAIVVAFGLAICIVSTWVVSTKLISLSKDDLYY